MTVLHRRWHRWLWLALAPAIAIGFIAALLARPPLPSRERPLPAQVEKRP